MEARANSFKYLPTLLCVCVCVCGDSYSYRYWLHGKSIFYLLALCVLCVLCVLRRLCLQGCGTTLEKSLLRSLCNCGASSCSSRVHIVDMFVPARSALNCSWCCSFCSLFFFERAKKGGNWLPAHSLPTPYPLLISPTPTRCSRQCLRLVYLWLSVYNLFRVHRMSMPNDGCIGHEHLSGLFVTLLHSYTDTLLHCYIPTLNPAPKRTRVSTCVCILQIQPEVATADELNSVQLSWALTSRSLLY